MTEPLTPTAPQPDEETTATPPGTLHLPDPGAGEAPEGADPAIWADLHRALWADPRRPGDVYRLRRHGVVDPKEVAKALGVASSSFVGNVNNVLLAVVRGEAPTTANYARATAQTAKRLREVEHLSPGAQAHLRTLEKAARVVADDPEERSREERAAATATDAVEEKQQAGVYVYALPHYLSKPYEEAERSRTLLKVGISLRDAKQRANNQFRDTALPERPVLLRIYRPTSAPAAVSIKTLEAKFHAHLRAADHDKDPRLGGGQEWFLTTLRMVDSVADLLELDITEVNSEFVPAYLV